MMMALMKVTMWKNSFHNGQKFLNRGVTTTNKNASFGKMMLRKICCPDGQENRPTQASIHVEVNKRINSIRKEDTVISQVKVRGVLDSKNPVEKNYTLLYDIDAKYPYHEVNQQRMKKVDSYGSIEELKNQLLFSRQDKNSTAVPAITESLSEILATDLHQLPQRCNNHKRTSRTSQGEAALSLYSFIDSLFKFFDHENFIACKRVYCGLDIAVEVHNGDSFDFKRKFVLPDKAITCCGNSFVRSMVEIKATDYEDLHDFLKSIIVCSISAMALRGNFTSVEIPFLTGNHEELTLYSVVLNANDDYPKTFKVCYASTYDPHQMKELAFNLMAILVGQYDTITSDPQVLII